MDEPNSGAESYRALWNEFASGDPLWAVLAFSDKRGNLWDVRDFMRVGEREIGLTLLHADERGQQVRLGRALDFGCGVGRLTQALGRRFERTLGVDISDEMIRLARSLNQYPSAVSYQVLGPLGLGGISGESFDFVYSVVVLQHMPPGEATRAIQHFGRLLRPGGVAVFQLPSHRVDPATVETKPMPDHGYQSEVRVVGDSVGSLCTGESRRLELTVRNSSSVTWIQKELGSLRIGNHWLSESADRMVLQDDGRSVMPMVVDAGTTFVGDLVVTAPNDPGVYLLEIDLVHEAVAWFAEKGSRTAQYRVCVVRGTPTFRTQRKQLIEKPVPAYPALNVAGRRAPANELEFPMFGVSRDAVLATVRESGLQAFHVEDDPRAGHDWVSYLYFTRKPPR